MRIADTCPFFHLKKFESTHHKFKSKDHDKMIDQIVELCDGISSEDRGKIKDSVKNMARAVFGDKKSEEWKNLFSENILDATESTPKITIMFTSIHMKHVKSEIF